MIAREARPLVVMALLLALFGCGNPEPNAGKLTPQGQSMQRMLADVLVLRGYAQGAGTRPAAEAAANDLVSWSDQLSTLFPETAALYVDMTPDIARRAPPILRETATAVVAAVHAGNRREAGTQLARTERDGCGICHRSGY